MPARADHVQPAQFGDPLMVGLVGSAEPDVGAAPGHLGGYRDRSELAGLGDHVRLFGVVLRVEHDRGYAPAQQPLVQLFGFGHVTSADQHRLPGLVDVRDVGNDRVVLGGGGDVDPVGLVLANVGSIRRNWRNTELVELAQLLTGVQRGAGHAAYGLLAVDERLHRDGVEDFAGLGRLDSLLGLDGGLQAVGPPLQLRDAAARGVDQVHRVVPHDVVHVALQKHMRVQCDVDLGQCGADMFLRVQVDAAERLFDFAGADFGQVDVATVGVGVVVGVRGEFPDQLDDLQPRRLPVRGAGQHERHQRLV